MLHKYIITGILFFLVLLDNQAQNKVTLNGTIRDKASGEEIIGATIRIAELSKIGISTNEYGFFSLTLEPGNYTFITSYIGYEDYIEKINLQATQSIKWTLQQKSQNLEEVKIVAKKENENITQTTMGVEKINMKDIAKLPVLFGEKDILKTIQLLPGVKSAGEGNSGFYVRGGTSDQNLILLDEAPVYNASHLLGFFSTFNSDAIKDAILIKGNSPAQYGGRLASVLDIKMNEGNDKDYHATGGIGLISSRLSIEGPIQKEKSSFLVTGRRTYADVFLQATEDFKDNTLYFYDLNAKANYRLDKNNRIFLSGYLGRDVLGLGDQFGIDWGNTTGTLRWNSVISPKLFSNTSLIYSDYDYNIQIQGDDIKFNINSSIQDWNLKQEFQYFQSTKSSWRVGLNLIHHELAPSRFEGDAEVFNSLNTVSRKSLENALYANHVYKLTNRLNIDYGLRLSVYSILGGDTYNVYQDGEKTESIVLSKNKIGKTFVNPEPRLALNAQLTENSSFKVGYARNTQNLHLLSNSTSGSPTDAWIGNSYNIKPEISDQVSGGYFRNFRDNEYEMSVETYYKKMQHQVDYKNGADIQTAPDVESELLFGDGRAYGAEFFIKKRKGTFTGWISYTLSRTERKINGINENKWYNAKQDRTHDLAVVASYQLTKRWSLSSNFVFYTGNAVTFPSGKYNIEDRTIYYYTERNGYRMPNYHRLDFSANYEGRQDRKWRSSWNFSLYNVYGRENAYTITFKDDPDDPSKTLAEQTALFKWVPSITYN
ncbi:MAG TPA: TonB-dependent receptor, partial [Saprospiraceae bacterium]|nr:TonB-dependent receptor [Saprospiraceae bacterium]